MSSEKYEESAYNLNLGFANKSCTNRVFHILGESRLVGNTNHLRPIYLP
jgi:hypothetical protein